MPILGTQINRLLAERGELKPGIKISSSVDIVNISKKDVFIGGEKKTVLNVEFKFQVLYGEDSGKIVIEGSLLYDGEKKEIAKIERDWKKKKKIDEQLTLAILNQAMEFSYIQAIPLANTMKLPPPLRLPRFRKREE